MIWTEQRPFQALALTGGGYRGLFAARALQAMEEHIGVPIAQRFDLLCGTSIGGVIALAAAYEVPMSRVVKIFEARGEFIFPPHRPPASLPGRLFDLYKHAWKPRYEARRLREVVLELIPAVATLGDARHPLAIPAVNVTQGKPQVFKTRHKSDWVRDSRLKAVDVAMATAAAPTFFELAEVSGSLYADGGLFANAPDLISIHEAEHFFNVPAGAIRILSIGTTTKSYSISFGAGRRFGIVDWMDDQRLFSVMISAQQQFVDQLILHRLGNRYLRIDHEPSQEQAGDLGLDNASSDARRTLIALADKVVTDRLGNALAPYLKHIPQLTVLEPQNG